MTQQTTWIVAGLGNPGRKYQGTRHNIGFMVIDELADRYPGGTEKNRFQSALLEIPVPDGKLILLKPQTFMNLSGQAVSQARNWYKTPVENLLVVYDDLDLNLGQIRIRASGSAGGHNGLGSIIESLGKNNVPRLRVGIDRPEYGSTVSYVLSRFREDEMPFLPPVISGSADAVEYWMHNGVTETMNRFNGAAFEPAKSPQQATQRKQTSESKGLGDYVRRLTRALGNR